MAKKPSIQKAILKTISQKKAISMKSIKENIKDSTYYKDKNQANTVDKKKLNYAITRSVNNLLSGGLIESLNSERSQYFRLTKNGKQKLNNIILESDLSLVSTRWDGFWRIILLDLSEERKSEREALRYLLKKAGFFCVKNSVWISMYPFEHLFTNIKKDLNLSTEMMILVTDKVDKKTEKEFFSICKINT